MLKKTKLFIIFLCTLFLVPFFYSPKAHAETKPEIAAEGAVLMDLLTGQILYSKNMDEKFAPASTTKILTALITLEKTQLTDKVVVGKAPPFEDGSKIFIHEGEEFTVEQLLYSLLLESANDSALALAEHISGSKEEFAKLMNLKSLEIGCKNSSFTNPNGLYEDSHYTTAYDLALISKKAMENETFRKIVSTVSYQIPPTNKQPQTRYFHNHNKFIRYKSMYLGVDGVKTGYTTKSKHTFVGSVTREDRKLLTVILKSPTQTYDDVEKLFDYGFENYDCQKIISKEDLLENVKIDGTSDEIPVYLKDDFYLSYVKGKNAEFYKKIHLNPAPNEIKKGDSIGVMELTTNDGFKTELPVISGVDYVSSIYNIETDQNGNLISVFKYTNIILSLIGVIIVVAILVIYSVKKKKSRW